MAIFKLTVAGFLQGPVSIDTALKCVEHAEQAVEATLMLRVYKRVLTLISEARGSSVAARIDFIEDQMVKNLTLNAGEILYQSTSAISNLAANAELKALAEVVSTARAIQTM